MLRYDSLPGEGCPASGKQRAGTHLSRRPIPGPDRHGRKINTGHQRALAAHRVEQGSSTFINEAACQIGGSASVFAPARGSHAIMGAESTQGAQRLRQCPPAEIVLGWHRLIASGGFAA
jgi:hypothetical protein